MAKRLGLLIALVAASLVALPRPATAAVTWKTVTTTATIAASEVKTVKLQCPGGYFVVGGGVSISAYSSAVRLQASLPLDDLDVNELTEDGWVAMYRNASDRLRTITVTATCASGLRLAWVQRTTSVSGSGQRQGTGVECPSGYSVLSGGARLGTGGTAGTFALTDLYPFGSAAFSAAAVGFEGSDVRRTFTVYAVCSVTKPVITARSSSVNGGAATSSLSSCASTQVATGGGVRLDSSNGLQNVITAWPKHTQGDSLPDAWSTLLVNKGTSSRALTFFRICLAR